jgi:arginine-tRNA-protein transferase
MSIQGIMMQPTMEECVYLEGKTSISDNLLVFDLEDRDMEALLSLGFRHFGSVFFRHNCLHCLRCISIRIPVQKFSPSRSVRRLFNRNKHLTVTLETPVPSQELYELYNRHKKRFKKQPPESYELYLNSFFHPFQFNRILAVRDGTRAVAITHLDVTANCMSAVYCYYDEDYARNSPGKFSVYKELELAKEMGIKWLYLGYYIPENRHTAYKVQFKPNQVKTVDNRWLDYLDHKGNIVNPLPPTPAFGDKEPFLRKKVP